MAKPSTRVPTITAKFNQLLPPQMLARFAEESGFIQRHRKLPVVPFFWSLVLGPRFGVPFTLAAMQLVFHAMAGVHLARSAYLDRFTNALGAFLELCLARMLRVQLTALGNPQLLVAFREICAIDSTLLALRPALADVFPGPRTNTCPAALKINVVYNVTRGTLRRLELAPGKRAESKFLQIDPDVRGALLLMDLGYFAYPVFARIARYGGYFVSRLKANANPVVVADLAGGPGRRRPVVGQRLHDVLKDLKRDELDLEVEVRGARRSPRRTGRRKYTRSPLRFRLVGVRHPETRELHLYLTNLSPDAYSPEEVRHLYRCRWTIELLFRELKQYDALDHMPSRKPEVVRALVYAALLRLLLSRVALETLRRRLGMSPVDADSSMLSALHEKTRNKLLRQRTPNLRFAAVWNTLSVFLLPDMLREAGIPFSTVHLESLLLLAAIDPNKRRRRLIGDLCDL